MSPNLTGQVSNHTI